MYYFCSTDTKPIGFKIVRVTILQTDTETAKPIVNRDRASRLMVEAPQSDIYVLPEMWPTGFITDKALMAEFCEDVTEHSHSSLAWMADMAAHLGGAVSGSIAIKDEAGLYRNRLYFACPDGACYFYDKRHLFTYGGEDKHYERGNGRVVVDYGGFRILLATCYDLRFPVWLRNGGDYDALLIVANWPKSRQAVWRTLLRARAIENQCFVIGANRTGNGYCGDSAIIDSKGITLAEATTNSEQSVTADLDLASQNRFRDKFPVLLDGDDFCINTKIKTTPII